MQCARQLLDKNGTLAVCKASFALAATEGDQATIVDKCVPDIFSWLHYLCDISEWLA
jgi:hypothetical protein